MLKRSYQSAREVMTKKLVFIDGMATAKEAVEIMRREKVEALIVKKRDELDAYGIVDINDFIRGIIITNKTSDDVNVYEIMTKPAISIPASMDVVYVASMLIKIGSGMAPVEEKGEYIGMVSLSDLIIENALF